jgi:hypothetical protein
MSWRKLSCCLLVAVGYTFFVPILITNFAFAGPDSEHEYWMKIYEMKQGEFWKLDLSFAEQMSLVCEMALIKAERYDRERGLSFMDQIEFVESVFPSFHFTVVEGGGFELCVKTVEHPRENESGEFIGLSFSGKTLVLELSTLLDYLGVDSVADLRESGFFS